MACALLFAGCDKSNEYHDQATDDCTNLTIDLERLDPGDWVNLIYNDRLLMRHHVDLTESKLHFDFCTRFKKTGNLKLIIRAGLHARLDKTLQVNRPSKTMRLKVDANSQRIELSDN